MSFLGLKICEDTCDSLNLNADSRGFIQIVQESTSDYRLRVKNMYTLKSSNFHLMRT